jgi:hypothetical protein
VTPGSFAVLVIRMREAQALVDKERDPLERDRLRRCARVLEAAVDAAAPSFRQPSLFGDS